MEIHMAKNTTAKPELDLDVRISGLLSAPDAHASSVFMDMIAEVEAAILDTDAIIRDCRAREVDPAVVDPGARGRADDSEVVAHRLHNALVKLRELRMAAVAREEATAWRADADKVQAVRDQLAAEFALRYPAIVSELVGLFTSITACDREIDRIHNSAPDIENRRLRKVEAEARRIDLTLGSILENCRLPNLLIGQHGASQAWPLSQPNVGLQLLSIFPKNGSPGSEEDEFYELVYDEVAGHYTMRRRPDAPPLALPSLRSRSDTAHP
jgi:hypothetical protein